MTSRKRARFTATAFLKGLVIAGGIASLATIPQAQVPVSDPPQANGVRFPVAVQHAGSWCYGYLYASSDHLGLQVVRPEADTKLSFDAPRAQVAVGQWILLGIPQDAIVVKANGATYIMRWLAEEGEVKSGALRRWSPPNSLPPYPLLAALENPGTALPQGGNPGDNATPTAINTQRPAPVANTDNQPAAASLARTSAGPVQDNTVQNIPPGMLAGVYIATTDGARPKNDQYLFYPDGYMVYGVPQKGMLGFDLTHYRAQDNPDKNWVARYKVEGHKIKYVWQNQWGDPANPGEMEFDENSALPEFKVGQAPIIPMCHCTGKRLSGTYRWGAPAQDQFIQFFPDGTFLDHRATDELLVISFDHPRIQRGTYQIVDQTIVFNFADGHRGTNSLLAPKVQKDNPTFDWISFGWHMFFEEGYRTKLSQGW